MCWISLVALSITLSILKMMVARVESKLIRLTLTMRREDL